MSGHALLCDASDGRGGDGGAGDGEAFPFGRDSVLMTKSPMKVKLERLGKSVKMTFECSDQTEAKNVYAEIQSQADRGRVDLSLDAKRVEGRI